MKAQRVEAIGGVGAQVDQVSNGTLVTIRGKHAPFCEVMVAAYGNVVAGALDKGSGEFEFSFRADLFQFGDLQVFAEDPAAKTKGVRITQGGSWSLLLPPTLVENVDVYVDENSVAIGGYSYPGAIVTITRTAQDGSEVVDTSVAEADGGWELNYRNLTSGIYQVTATAAVGGLLSQKSDELEIVVEEPLPAVMEPLGNVGTQVSKVVVSVAEAVLPPKVSQAVKEVAPQAKQVSETVTPVAAAGLLTQLTLIGRDILFLLVQTGIAAMQYFGFWRKRHPWGVVYDAVTKQPIMLATVRLYSFDKTLKLIETDVTSKAGIFSFFPKAGTYIIKVAKSGYEFPSRIIKGREDGEYAHIYHGEQIGFREEKEVVEVAVPVDPRQAMIDWKFKLKNLVRSNIYRLTLVSLVLGWAMSLLAAVGGEGGINGFFLLFYSMMLSMQAYLAYRKRKTWGTVVDREGNPVKGVQLDLINPQFKNLVQRRVSDEKGSYQFVVPEGRYVIRVSSVSYKLVTNIKKAYMGQEIVVEGRRPRIIVLKVVVEAVKEGEVSDEVGD